MYGVLRAAACTWGGGGGRAAIFNCFLSQGLVINYDGKISPIVHQYDRCVCARARACSCVCIRVCVCVCVLCCVYSRAD